MCKILERIGSSFEVQSRWRGSISGLLNKNVGVFSHLRLRPT